LKINTFSNLANKQGNIYELPSIENFRKISYVVCRMDLSLHWQKKILVYMF